MNASGLSGRVALVTGANNPLGIGAATARALAARGAAVFITSFRRPPAASPAELERARRAGTGGPAFYEAVGQEPPEAIVREIEARWLTGQLLYVGGGWKMPV